jgi:hypothetical protein
MAIDSVYTLGDDALQNMAEITFAPGFALLGVADMLKFRTTNIEIPNFATGAYIVHWKTQNFEKPSGKDETQKTMTFTFRVDKYYLVYKALLKWREMICNSDSGAMAEDVVAGVSLIRTNFSVRAVDSRGVVTTNGWEFENAWLKDIAAISFDETTGDPISLQVTMSFLKMVPKF